MVAMPCGCGMSRCEAPTSQEVMLAPRPLATDEPRHWFVVPSPGPNRWRVGDTTYVSLRSERDTGRAAVVECTSQEEHGGGEDARVKVKFDCCGLEAHVRPARLSPVRSIPNQKRCGLVTASTDAYRKLARSELTRQDFVLEIGSSLGLCTQTLAQHARWVIGMDNSKENVAKTQEEYPWLQFERLDPFLEPEKVLQLAVGYNVVFVDIGGNRELNAVVRLVQWVEEELDPRLIVVKSQAMHATLAKKEYNGAQPWTDETGRVCNSEKWWSGLQERIKKSWCHHPLKAPKKCTRTGNIICRYHNYTKEGCKKRSTCLYDHETCHICLQEGHVALYCPMHLVGEK